MVSHKNLTQWYRDNADQIDAVVFDIDGVLLLTGGAAPGAQRLLSLLHKAQVPYCLLTNDGNHSPFEKMMLLKKAGVSVAPEDIISCSHGLIPFVKKQGVSEKLFFAMGDLGVPCYGEAAGLKITRDVGKLSLCTGVIVSEENFDWESNINAVTNFFIDHPDAFFICPNPDEYYPGDGTLKIMLSSGSITRLIEHTLSEYGIDVSPVYFGKPYSPIFEYTHRFLEKKAGRTISNHRVLMVGDNLDADIDGANNVGFSSALMLTGITTRTKLDNSDVVPDFVFETL